jgi:hypothetical protein
MLVERRRSGQPRSPEPFTRARGRSGSGSSIAVRRKTRRRPHSPERQRPPGPQRCRQKTPAAERTRRLKRVTRREASHPPTSVSTRASTGFPGCSSLTSWVCTSSIDALCFGASARRSVRGTPRPRSLALAGARDEGWAKGAAHPPRVRFRLGPGADARARDAIQRTRRSSGASRGGRENRPPPRTPDFRVQRPFVGRARGCSMEHGRAVPGDRRNVSDGYERTSLLSRRRRRFKSAHAALAAKPHQSGRALDCAALRTGPSRREPRGSEERNPVCS